MKTLLTLLLLLIVSCSQAPAAVVIDAVGRRVEVPERPQRIISLIPSIAETLFAIGAGERLVAVTDYTNFPAAAKQIPSIGSYADPSLETILSYQPDLIIATTDGTPLALVQQLTRLKLPVFVISSHTIATALTAIETLGKITASEAAATALVSDIRKRLAVINNHLTARPPVQVLACVMLQPLVVAGPGTFVDDLVRHAGGNNVVPPGPSHYPTWNMEALLRADPDVIVVSAHPGQPAPAVIFDNWPQLQAVRGQRIKIMEADWIHRPGPRMILGIEALAKALHPDIDFEN